MTTVHVPSPKLWWLKPRDSAFTLDMMIERPNTGVKEKRRSKRKRSKCNYDETDDVGDKVTVDFEDDNRCIRGYDGTIIGVHGLNLSVKFHHDNETWMCYRKGKTIHARFNGKQDTS